MEGCLKDSAQLAFVRRLKRYPLQVRHKQDWGRGFILLLPQTVVLHESDADSDVIKIYIYIGFVIQNRQTSCSMWCPNIGHAVRTWSVVCSEAPHLSTGHKSTEPGRIFAVLHFPLVIFPFRGADTKSCKFVQKIPRSWHKRASGSYSCLASI